MSLLDLPNKCIEVVLLPDSIHMLVWFSYILSHKGPIVEIFRCSRARKSWTNAEGLEEFFIRRIMCKCILIKCKYFLDWKNISPNIAFQFLHLCRILPLILYSWSKYLHLLSYIVLFNLVAVLSDSRHLFTSAESNYREKKC